MTAARPTWSIKVSLIDGALPDDDDAVTYPDALTLADALRAWLTSSTFDGVRCMHWHASIGAARGVAAGSADRIDDGWRVVSWGPPRQSMRVSAG